MKILNNNQLDDITQNNKKNSDRIFDITRGNHKKVNEHFENFLSESNTFINSRNFIRIKKYFLNFISIFTI